MAIKRSGLSRDINYDALAGAEFGVGIPKPKPKPAGNAYASADAGSLDTIIRAPKPAPSYDESWAAADAGSLTNYKPWRNWTEIAGTKINLDQTPEQIAAAIQAAFSTGFGSAGGYGTGGTGGTGGSGSTLDKEAYAKAINEYLAAAEAGRTDWASMQADIASRYGGYNQRLADIAASANARQEASAARAAEALAAIDPQAAFQYNVTPATIGAGSGADYLRSIGASTGDVDAVRQFEQSLLNQAMGGAQQYSEATQRALDIERAARQASVPQMLQEAQAAASAQQMAYQLGLSESERKALEAVLSGKSAEEQSIAEKILNARLAAAEMGVTL